MSATTSSVAHRFSTSSLPERDRVSRWREEFGRGLVQVDLEPLSSGERPFHQEATLLALPGVNIAVCSGSAARYDRTRALAAKGDGSIGLIINLEGNAAATQFDREVTLAPGDAIAVVPNEPGVLTCTGQLGLVLPRSALATRVSDIEGAAMRLIPSECEPLRLLKRYLTLVRNEMTLSIDDPNLRQTVANHIHDLIALAIGSNRDTRHTGLSAVAAVRLADALADIARNFTDPGLSLTILARRQGVSPRYLQRLFETSGISYTSRIQELRLLRASTLLAQSDLHPRRISDIAMEVGFADVSHFNRLFRSRFGETPTAARSRGLKS
jgi:AraC-like DNA-binding protein